MIAKWKAFASRWFFPVGLSILMVAATACCLVFSLWSYFSTKVAKLETEVIVPKQLVVYEATEIGKTL